MFWETYPWWKHFFSSSFDSYPFERDPVTLPSSTTLIHLSHPSSHSSLLSPLCKFLFTHFAKQPRLCHTPETLLSPKDHLFVLYHSTTHTILATIRYHYLGVFYSSTSPPIYLVDALCVHPDWRHKGLGTYLLTELHRYANHHSIPYALFLKEGPSLPLPLSRLSGSYVYRNLHLPLSLPLSSTTKVISLTSEEAHRWITSYMTIFPDTFLIYHSQSPHAIWKAYLSPPFSILACFQDTHQRIMTSSKQQEQKQKMGWVTVWLESPLLTNTIRHEASLSLSNSVSHVYEWVWMNRKWTGIEDHALSPWKEDGGFHWYTYQWNTNHNMNHSYGIMIH